VTQIYCDIADIKTIKKYSSKKIVKGITTNPSLMRKAGAKNYELYSKEILKVCKNKPISFEVFADDYKNILKQALKIKSWGRNVYVKIPVENSKGISLVFSLLVFTSCTNFVPGLRVAAPCGCTTIFSNVLHPLKYLPTSVLPSNLGDNSPAVKFVKATVCFATTTSN